ncbi:MAG: hypothetical protein F6J99_20900 [Moorea sp. SIO4G3]|nr:hypothetical protein [Moorena sp. SIO4G3]
MSNCRGFPHERLHQDTGILPVSIYFRWNWHLASFNIFSVELASCQFQYIFRRAGCPLYSYSFQD